MLSVVAIILVASIWKMLEATPLPGKLRRWGKQAIPAGECGLTFAQIDEASRDFARTFGALALAASPPHCSATPLPLAPFLPLTSHRGRGAPQLPAA